MAEFFSRMGMGLEEARQKESEMRDIQSDVNETRFMSRGMRRAFRDASRAGNPMAVANILQIAKEQNVPLTSGGRRAGDLERSVSNRYYEKRAAWEKTRAGAKQGAATGWDQDGNGIPNSIQRDPATNPLAPTPVSPLGSKMNFASDERVKRDAYNEHNGNIPADPDPIASFTSNLASSKLIGSGDLMAQKRAVEQGVKLGLSVDDVGSIGGFNARDAASYVEDPFKNATPATPSLSSPRPMTPMEALVARIRGGADSPTAEMVSAREKTDSLKKAGAHNLAASEDLRGRMYDKVLETRDRIQTDANQRHAERLQWDAQMDRYKGMKEQSVNKDLTDIQSNLNAGRFVGLRNTAIGRVFGLSDRQSTSAKDTKTLWGDADISRSKTAAELKSTLDSAEDQSALKPGVSNQLMKSLTNRLDLAVGKSESSGGTSRLSQMATLGLEALGESLSSKSPSNISNPYSSYTPAKSAKQIEEEYRKAGEKKRKKK